MPKGSRGFQKGNKLGKKFKKGEKPSPEQIERLRKRMVGNSLTKGKKQKPRGEEYRNKLSEAHRGEKSYNWKGGTSKLSFIIRNCFKYRQWRSDVFTRDNFTCQECGQRGGYIEAHHLNEFYKILEEYKIKSLEEALICEELWNINNGKTLCRKCHDKTKKKKYD